MIFVDIFYFRNRTDLKMLIQNVGLGLCSSPIILQYFFYYFLSHVSVRRFAYFENIYAHNQIICKTI